ncbi:MAG: TIGR02647 family protein [Porticoccaceae bacterium]
MSTTQQGIKVHSDASESVIAATARLFEKGLLSQADGGIPPPWGWKRQSTRRRCWGCLNKPLTVYFT